MPLLIFDRGPGFWVYYSCVMLLDLVTLAIRIGALAVPTLSVSNTILLIIGILIPLTVDMIGVIGIPEIRTYNVTPNPDKPEPKREKERRESCSKG